MMDWTLVLVADMVEGEGARLKKRRRMEEMVAVFAKRWTARSLVREELGFGGGEWGEGVRGFVDVGVVWVGGLEEWW